MRTDARSRSILRDTNDGVLLGVVDGRLQLRLFVAAPSTQLSRRLFRGHQAILDDRAVEGQIQGGFSIILKNGKLTALCRRSILNDPAADYLLPDTIVERIVKALRIPKSTGFRIYS